MNPANSAQALSQLQATQAQSQDPNTILSNQNQQLGVSKAQDTVTGLRGAINNTTKLLQQVAPSVMGRTASSLVTNAQAGKQIQNEQAPISANLTQEGTDYNQANTDLSALRGQAQTAASGIYQGQQDKLSYAQNLYNTLYKQEQDASQAAEQKREFDAQQAAAVQAARLAASSGNFILPGASSSSAGATKSTSPAPAAGKSQQDAYNAVRSLLDTKNSNLIKTTIDAIRKSANYGNPYDKMKLELLTSMAPNTQALSGILGSPVAVDRSVSF